MKTVQRVPRGTREKKLQNLDATQLKADFGNAHIKSIIYLFQEAEYALIDSSVTKGYEHYNTS
jgi:hypothetical protein